MVEDTLMNEREFVWQERRLEEILFSNASPASKSQQIIRIGFDPEIADQIVEQHELGTARSNVYYESLDFADMDDEPIDEQDLTTDEHVATDRR